MLSVWLMLSEAYDAAAHDVERCSGSARQLKRMSGQLAGELVVQPAGQGTTLSLALSGACGGERDCSTLQGSCCSSRRGSWQALAGQLVRQQLIAHGFTAVLTH